MLSARFLPIIVTMGLYLKVLPLCLLVSATFSVAAEEAESPASQAPTASGATASTPEIPRTEPDIDQTIISNLSKLTFPDTELLQLDTGKDNEKLIAFYQAESSGVLQGGIIIFPNDKTHFDWPGDLNHLRTGLTEYGWHTLAIYLPRTEAPAIPERTLPVLKSISASDQTDNTSTDNAAETTTGTASTTETAVSAAKTPEQSSTDAVPEEPEEPYHEQAMRRALAASTYLKQQEAERIIVMGIGTGAVWAAQYVQQFQDSQDLRLVMLDAQPPKTKSAPDLLTILPEIKTTIIDLHHSDRMSTASRDPVSAARRLKTARQNALTNYHQSRLPAIRDDWKKANPWLLKHLRGLLSTYVVKADQMATPQNQGATLANGEKAPGTQPN